MLDKANNLLQYSRTFKIPAITMLLSYLVYLNTDDDSKNDDVLDDIKQIRTKGTDYDDLEFWYAVNGHLTEICFDKQDLVEGKTYNKGMWYHITYNGKSNQLTCKEVQL